MYMYCTCTCTCTCICIKLMYMCMHTHGSHRNDYFIVLHKQWKLMFNILRPLSTIHLLDEVRAQVLDSLHGNFLEALNTAWADHQTAMVMIRDILMYMVSTHLYTCTCMPHIYVHVSHCQMYMYMYMYMFKKSLCPLSLPLSGPSVCPPK